MKYVPAAGFNSGIMTSQEKVLNRGKRFTLAGAKHGYEKE